MTGMKTAVLSFFCTLLCFSTLAAGKNFELFKCTDSAGESLALCGGYVSHTDPEDTLMYSKSPGDFSLSSDPDDEDYVLIPVIVRSGMLTGSDVKCTFRDWDASETHRCFIMTDDQVYEKFCHTCGNNYFRAMGWSKRSDRYWIVMEYRGGTRWDGFATVNVKLRDDVHGLVDVVTAYFARIQEVKKDLYHPKDVYSGTLLKWDRNYMYASPLYYSAFGYWVEFERTDEAYATWLRHGVWNPLSFDVESAGTVVVRSPSFSSAKHNCASGPGWGIGLSGAAVSCSRDGYTIRANVGRAGTVQLLRDFSKDDDPESLIIDKIAFYPSSGKSLFINVSSLQSMEDNAWHYFAGGRVCGGGSFKSGETAKITAKPVNGWVFDHWIIKRREPYGGYFWDETIEIPSEIDLCSNPLRFKIPDSWCGTCSEEKEILIRPEWRKSSDSVLPDWTCGTWGGELVYDGQDYVYGTFSVVVYPNGSFCMRSNTGILEETRGTIRKIQDDVYELVGEMSYGYTLRLNREGGSTIVIKPESASSKTLKGYCRKVGSNPKFYTVSFDAKGGTVKGLSGRCFCVGSVDKLPLASTFITPPAGRKFAGWMCTNGKRYDDGMLVYNLADDDGYVKMVAIWK